MAELRQITELENMTLKNHMLQMELLRRAFADEQAAAGAFVKQMGIPEGQEVQRKPDGNWHIVETPKPEPKKGKKA